MQRFSKRALIGLAAVAVAVPVVATAPVFASLRESGMAIAQKLTSPKVQLNLSAEKQVLTKDAGGAEKTNWQALQGQVSVNPGDVLRYTVSGKNAGQAAAKKLVVTQPVPKQTLYVLDSATPAPGAQMTFSIDGGKSFVAKPMVKVTLPDGKLTEKPAPAEAYSHVRWEYGADLAADAEVKASYQVKVR
jgi:uncharacterized repeat protein (TIGR01451 family)